MISQFIYCLSLGLIIFIPLMTILCSFSTSTLLKEYWLSWILYGTDRRVFIQNLDLTLRVLPFYTIVTGMPLLIVADILLFLENPWYSESCFLWIGISLFMTGGLDSAIRLKGHRDIFKTIVSRCQNEQKEEMSDKGSFIKHIMNGSLSMRKLLMAFGIASMALYGLIWFDNAFTSF